ncbi:hypothetical protein DMUE_4672 [Dictyocoela muelleri]|nr:hypothetical protein DMUE_4672 [Dictyocoela muelleri]
MFLNLEYVPTCSVFIFFYMLVKKLSREYPEGLEFGDYFKGHYIGDELKTSSYSINFWNCYKVVLNDIPRTINYSEARHISLNSLSSVDNVNLGKFVDFI